MDLVCATRDPDHYKIAVKDFIQLGASPRADDCVDAGRQSLRLSQGPRLRDARRT